MGATLSKKVDNDLIKKEINDFAVLMYSKPRCGYCNMAKQLLQEENITFEEKNLDLVKATMASESRFQEYVNGLVYLTRQTTVPQIFICGEFIGGYTELNKLREAKDLWNRINQCADQYGKVTL